MKLSEAFDGLKAAIVRSLASPGVIPFLFLCSFILVLVCQGWHPSERTQNIVLANGGRLLAYTNPSSSYEGCFDNFVRYIAPGGSQLTQLSYSKCCGSNPDEKPKFEASGQLVLFTTACSPKALYVLTAQGNWKEYDFSSSEYSKYALWNDDGGSLEENFGRNFKKHDCDKIVSLSADRREVVVENYSPVVRRLTFQLSADGSQLSLERLERISPTEEYVESNIALLRSDDCECRKSAILNLESLAAEKAEISLIAALDDSIKEVREAAADALCAIKGPRAAEAFIAIAENKARPLHACAARWLCDFDHPRMPDILLKILQDPEAQCVGYAIKKLGATGDIRAVEPLLALLQDTQQNNSSEREGAAEVLSAFQDPRVIPALEKSAQEDPEARVREHAKKSLEKLKN
jgi:hypothetical protein